jgi:hypothetical protein
MDIWHAFIVGRPCSLDLTLVDCPRPSDSGTGPGDLPGFIAGCQFILIQFPLNSVGSLSSLHRQRLEIQIFLTYKQRAPGRSTTDTSQVLRGLDAGTPGA